MLPAKIGKERPEFTHPLRPALSAEGTQPGGIEGAEVQSGGACLGVVVVLKTPERMWMVVPSMSDIEGVRPGNGVRRVVEPNQILLPHRLRCIEGRPQLEVGIERRGGQKGLVEEMPSTAATRAAKFRINSVKARDHSINVEYF
jgi:hypothetical protein